MSLRARAHLCLCLSVWMCVNALSYTAKLRCGTSHHDVYPPPSVLVPSSTKKHSHCYCHAFTQGKAIRGWEEAVKRMSLGERLEVTIGPKWAYRKGGLAHPDTGKYIVPPNATLVFEMRLVQVRDKAISDLGALAS